jgi:hypothetical protein
MAHLGVIETKIQKNSNKKLSGVAKMKRLAKKNKNKKRKK